MKKLLLIGLVVLGMASCSKKNDAYVVEPENKINLPDPNDIVFEPGTVDLEIKGSNFKSGD